MDRPNWSHNISIRVVVFIIGLLRREAESYDEAYSKAYPKSAEEPDHPRGLDLIKLPV